MDHRLKCKGKNYKAPRIKDKKIPFANLVQAKIYQDRKH